MHEFQADLDRLNRLSRVLALSFWCSALIAAAVLGYVLLVWIPRHPIV
jgi:hypothetical protein